MISAIGGRARLELPGDLVRRPAVYADVADHLAAAEEGGHGLEQVLPAPEHADPGGAAHLVAGEAVEVGAQLGHVGVQVGRVLGPVDQHQGPGGVGGVGQAPDRGQGPEHVGHGGDRQQLGPVEEAVQVAQVEATLGVDPDPAQLDPGLLGQHVPRDDVGVVLHLGQHDSVTGAQVGLAPGLGHQVEALGDVLGEHDAPVRGRPDEAGHLAPGLLHQPGGLLGDGIDAPVDVGVGRLVVVVHRVQHDLGLLGRRGRVEVADRLPVDLLGEEGEVLADGLRVEGHAATIPS